MHDNDVLDADPYFVSKQPATLPDDFPASVRVFPGARLTDAGSLSAPRDKVDLAVTLSVAPVEDLPVFVRSFDVDDPYTDTELTDPDGNPLNIQFPAEENHGRFVDPNDFTAPEDGSTPVHYQGANPIFNIAYTPEEDNRGRVSSHRAGRFVCTDRNNAAYENCSVADDNIAELVFKPAQTTKKVGFEVSRHPGDNYRTAANGDRDFLLRLRNTDIYDSYFLVDKSVTVPAPAADPREDAPYRQIRLSADYASPILGVWRLLHVENDSMTAPPLSGTEKNFVAGYIKRIYRYQSGRTGLAIDQNLRQLPGGEDLSPPPGRFEDEKILIGADKIETSLIRGNFVDNERDVVRSTSAGFNLPFRLTQGTLPALEGQVIRMTEITSAGESTVTLAGATLSTDYAGGTIVIAGTPGAVLTVSDAEAGKVKVKLPAAGIEFELYDDDSAQLPAFESLAGSIQAFAAAAVLPVPYVGEGNRQDSVPFVLNACDFDSIAWIYRDSAHLERKRFWVVYILEAYQDSTLKDNDPGKEGAVLGTVLGKDSISSLHNTKVARGYDGCLIFIETLRDTKKSLQFRNFTVAHEIGHQFGLSHGEHGGSIPEFSNAYAIGLMSKGGHYGCSTDNIIEQGFNPRHINLIRSRINPPGH